SAVAKRPRLGTMGGRSAGATPNQLARVATYWSGLGGGIHRPSLVKSSGPPRARVGKVPEVGRPRTAPPGDRRGLPPARSDPPPHAGFSVLPKSERVKVVTLPSTPSCTVA